MKWINSLMPTWFGKEKGDCPCCYRAKVGENGARCPPLPRCQWVAIPIEKIVVRKVAKVVGLYRSTTDLEHWLVPIPGAGWARFPAKVNGWAEHRMATMPNHRYLNRVPLWLAFNTGLLESLEKLGLERTYTANLCPLSWRG
jgi:hypothetical protein